MIGEVDAVRRRRAERDEPVLEPDPDVRLLERGHDRARQEGQHVLLLELPAERGGHVGVVGLSANDQAEAQDRAVDERGTRSLRISASGMKPVKGGSSGPDRAARWARTHSQATRGLSPEAVYAARAESASVTGVPVTANEIGRW